MKRFLALIIAVSAVSAHAITDRAIYDIMYLPQNGTKYGITEFGSLKRDVKGSGNNGDVDVSGWGVSQEIGFALTDKFTVNLQMSYLAAEVDQQGSTDYDQEGFTDPEVNGRFRLMDDDIKLDLLAGLLMNIGDAVIKADDTTGTVTDRNNLRGGNSLSGGAQVGQQKETYQWAFQALLTRNFEREYEIEGVDGKYKPTNDFLMRADLLNKLAEKSLIRSHISADFEQALVNKTSGFPDLDAPITTYELGTQYQHLFSRDLLARVGVEYARENSNNGQYSSDHAWTFIVGANYQF